AATNMPGSAQEPVGASHLQAPQSVGASRSANIGASATGALAGQSGASPSFPIHTRSGPSQEPGPSGAHWPWHASPPPVPAVDPPIPPTPLDPVVSSFRITPLVPQP